VPRGRVLLRRVPGARRLRYYLYWPRRSAPERPWLVAVHGISRNARDHARAFAAQAEATGTLVIAPLFEPDAFPDYQRLGRAGRGARADLALLDILADVAALTAQTPAPVNLFGFSGGGQFCQRFTLAHPHRVHRQVLVAAGWYTLPTQRRAYPLGLRLDAELPGVEFVPAEFLRVPTCVLVGALDTQRDEALRTGRRIDRNQGKHRVARGRRFIARLQRAAARLGLSTPLEFATLADCGHDFDACVRRADLVQRTLAFLYTQHLTQVETQS
jgi:pimeloyl-ACP methyl ester carboxylesterase